MMDKIEAEKKSDSDKKDDPIQIDTGDKSKSGPMNEMMKLGIGKEGSKKSNHLAPAGQLITIEEDLHETQTSHYS